MNQYLAYISFVADNNCTRTDAQDWYGDQVQVQRRETERQAEQRVNSYAYISQKESDEKWRQLRCSSAESEVAVKVWDKLTTPPEQDAAPDTMSRSSYLATILPSQYRDLSEPCMGRACLSGRMGHSASSKRD